MIDTTEFEIIYLNPEFWGVDNARIAIHRDYLRDEKELKYAFRVAVRVFLGYSKGKFLLDNAGYYTLKVAPPDHGDSDSPED